MTALSKAFCLMALLSALPSLGQMEPAGCLSYEPTVVSLHGVLQRKTVPGPPNYESLKKGDSPETYWFVNLESPICLTEDKSQPDLNPAKKDIRRVQLIIDPQAYEEHKDLLGKKVVATGTLFAAITGHHHTPVLLTVTHLDLPRWK